MSQNYIITHPDYKPKGITYGFIGTKLPLKNYCYKSHEDAEANRKKVLDAIGKEHCKLLVLNQIHSNICVDTPTSLVDADAQITKDRNVVLGILTADCVPVLFCDTKNKIIGGAHAGWKGAIGGVLENTIQALRNAGAEDLEAVIGPCIRQESYEVSEEFLQRFLDQTLEHRRFFIDSKKSGHYMFDLPGYVISILNRCGIKKIYDTKIDTLKEEDSFLSYRRSCLRGAIERPENNISFIAID